MEGPGLGAGEVGRFVERVQSLSLEDEEVLETGNREDHTATWVFSLALSWGLKNGLSDKFYVAYFITMKNKTQPDIL